MKYEDDLIYDLIFSEESNFIINITDYTSDIYNYKDFITHIRQILKKSKVKILKSSVIVDSNSVVWQLKVKK